MYQIVSGRYFACCGIAGGIPIPLPAPNDAFIELKVDLWNSAAEMRFLGQDMQTVLRSASDCGTDADFAFANGLVFPDFIRFYKRLDDAAPGPYYLFIISNSVGGLSVNGTLHVVPCPVADTFRALRTRMWWRFGCPSSRFAPAARSFVGIPSRIGPTNYSIARP